MLKANTDYNFKAGIYRISCTVNGKSYIGSSVNILERWREHISHLRAGAHHSIYLQRCYNKYGEESIKFEVLAILEEFNEELLRLVEYVYIEKLHPEFNTLTPMETNVSETWKRKISESTKKLYESGYINPRFNTGKRYKILDYQGNILRENEVIREVAILLDMHDYHFFNTVLKRNNGIAISRRGEYIVMTPEKTQEDLKSFYKSELAKPNKFGFTDSNGNFYSGILSKEQKTLKQKVLDSETLTYKEGEITYSLPGIVINAV